MERRAFHGRSRDHEGQFRPDHFRGYLGVSSGWATSWITKRVDGEPEGFLVEWRNWRRKEHTD